MSTVGDVERSNFLLPMILSITTFYTLVSSLRNILSLFVLLYNCLCSAGVGKSELVLRFVDSNFSGMPVLGCVKCQASCSR